MSNEHENTKNKPDPEAEYRGVAETVVTISAGLGGAKAAVDLIKAAKDAKKEKSED